MQGGGEPVREVALLLHLPSRTLLQLALHKHPFFAPLSSTTGRCDLSPQPGRCCLSSGVSTLQQLPQGSETSAGLWPVRDEDGGGGGGGPRAQLGLELLTLADTVPIACRGAEREPGGCGVPQAPSSRLPRWADKPGLGGGRAVITGCGQGVTGWG
jgi:hypothetical protein